MKRILLLNYKWIIVLGVIVILMPYMLTLHEKEKPILIFSNVRKSGMTGTGGREFNYYECRLIAEGWVNSGEAEITYENQVTGEKYVMNITAIGDFQKEIEVGKLERGINKNVYIYVNCKEGTDMNINIYIRGKQYGHEIFMAEFWGWLPKFGY